MTTLLERKAGAAAVDPDDFNAVVDAVVALGGAIGTRKAGAASVDSDDFNAVIDAAVTLGSNLGARKAGAGAVDPDDFNALIDGVYTLQQTPTGPALSAESLVTLTTNFSLGDGFVMANGDLYALSSNSPAKLACWRNPDTDMATYTTVTFPSDGTYNAPIGMRATAAGDFIYIAFRGFDTGTRYTVKIIKLDTSDLTYATLVNDDWGDSGVVFSPGAGDICLSATHLFYLNHSDISSGQAEVRKYLLSNGSLVSSQQITGRHRGHPIELDAVTGLLFFAGTDFATCWAGWMDPADLTSYDTVGVAASQTIEDDFVIRGSYLWFAAETANPVKILRVKKDLSTVDTLISSTVGTAHGMVMHPDGVNLLVGARDANKVVVFNADTLAEGTALSISSSLAKVNDLIRAGGLLYVATLETTSKVGRYAVT